MKIFSGFDDVDERRKRRRRRKTKTKTKTKDENVDRKRTEEEKKFFKTNVLVPREEGATVAATPYLLRCDTVRAGLARAERAAILHGDKLYRKPT